jgi:hypothetical protein
MLCINDLCNVHCLCVEKTNKRHYPDNIFKSIIIHKVLLIYYLFEERHIQSRNLICVVFIVLLLQVMP